MFDLETSLREILDTLQAEPKATSSALPVRCVLCQLVEKSVLTTLRFFFDEFVNDHAIRVTIRKARGFCREHTTALYQCGDALGTAILYCARLSRDLLGANGITDEYPIMRHLCNLETVKTYEGTDHIHTLVIGERVTGIAAYK